MDDLWGDDHQRHRLECQDALQTAVQSLSKAVPDCYRFCCDLGTKHMTIIDHESATAVMQRNRSVLRFET